jgi:hypothetical protein
VSSLPVGTCGNICAATGRQSSERENKRLVSRLRFASLRQNVVVEDIDIKGSITRCSTSSPANGSNGYQNLLIIGPTGVGKSGLHARSLTEPVGITARSSINAYGDCSMCSRLHAAGITPRLLESLARVELLILDDWDLLQRSPSVRSLTTSLPTDLMTSTREPAQQGGRDHRNPWPASIGTGGRLRGNPRPTSSECA